MGGSDARWAGAGELLLESRQTGFTWLRSSQSELGRSGRAEGGMGNLDGKEWKRSERGMDGGEWEGS